MKKYGKKIKVIAHTGTVSSISVVLQKIYWVLMGSSSWKKHYRIGQIQKKVMRKASDIKIPEIILREESDESWSDEVCDLETNIQTKQKKKVMQQRTKLRRQQISLSPKNKEALSKRCLYKLWNSLTLDEGESKSFASFKEGRGIYMDNKNIQSYDSNAKKEYLKG